MTVKLSEGRQVDKHGGVAAHEQPQALVPSFWLKGSAGPVALSNVLSCSFEAAFATCRPGNEGIAGLCIAWIAGQRMSYFAGTACIAGLPAACLVSRLTIVCVVHR